MYLKDTLKSASDAWYQLLREEFQESYFIKLDQFVEREYKGWTCYPPKHHVFEAFKRCHPKDVKVVILGQDPYHGKGQANGLAFSVNPHMKIPRSLRNIFKEVEHDCGESQLSAGDLYAWANQGVLLLNTVLTVKGGTAGSHRKRGWETFTNAVLTQINTFKNHVVFMLWGGDAKKKKKRITAPQHLILEANHPSPLSANRGGWFGCKHFSSANAFLKKRGIAPVRW